MAKNLAVFLDGTWNEPGDNTNVWRLKVMLASHTAAGAPQLAYYDTGVGTTRSERLRGGIGGSGLSLNVRQAYQWLIESYDDGDSVYVFGFSRGAYTARSLTGLIMKCGLLRPGAPMTSLDIYARYQLGKEKTPLHEIEFIDRTGKRPLEPDERRLLTHSRRIPIKMIGVWDTVGALGIPWTQAPLIGRGNFYFHNTNLSKLFEHAYHAIAVDENRSPYNATLWTRFTPAGEAARPLPSNHTIEQRWFIGAHCNVGGGYANDELAQIPLAWMHSKATSCGLAFRNGILLSGKEALCDPVDSYKEFMKGFWKFVKFGKRFHRTIDSAPRTVKSGMSDAVNQVIDSSVLMRYQQVREYRPKNLEDWAKRRGLDLNTLAGDQIV